MFIWTFLLRITHIIISQSIADSSWITLYIYIYIYHHRLYSLGRALASSWGFVTIFFYGVRLLTSCPNPNVEGQSIPFCLGHHPWPVCHGRPYATTSRALGVMWPHKPHHYAKIGIPSGIYILMSVCCECCVLSGRGLCDELITRTEESYRLWCVVVCDLETSRIRRPWTALGRNATRKNIYLLLLHLLLLFIYYWSRFHPLVTSQY